MMWVSSHKEHLAPSLDATLAFLAEGLGGVAWEGAGALSPPSPLPEPLLPPSARPRPTNLPPRCGAGARGVVAGKGRSGGPERA